MTVSTDYTAQEIIVVAGAKILEDNKIVFVGTGLPMVASLLAKLTHAPGLIPVFEAGAVGPPLHHGLPISVGDSKTFTGASYVKGLNGAFELTQIDTQIEVTQRLVDEAGVAENTLVIFTSDNGCSPQANFNELRSQGHDPSGVFRGTKAELSDQPRDVGHAGGDSEVQLPPALSVGVVFVIFMRSTHDLYIS